MPNTREHQDNKTQLGETIERMMSLAVETANIEDLKELLSYIPQHWLTTPPEWMLIGGLAELAELNARASLKSRQALVNGIREIGAAAGANLKTAAGGRS